MTKENKEKNIDEKKTEIKLLSLISNSIVSEKYVGDVLDVVVAVTAEIMDSKVCSIMLYDKKKEELSIAATQSLSKEYRNKPNLKINQSISGKALKKKAAVRVKDIFKDPDYSYPEIARKEGLRSMLAVPMMVREKVVGIVNLYLSRVHEFTDTEVNVLQLIANMAAVAIENKNLMEEILKARESLEERKLVERAKGILMKKENLSEEEAYKRIHKKSMNTRKSMREIAQAILLTMEITGS